MKIDRIISIIMILLQEDKISATKLSEMFEVSTRTIYRDIETISLAGIPIITYQGSGGGIGIMSEYKISKGLFSISDISSLLMALNNINLNISDKEIINTIAKVKGLIPLEHRDDIEKKSNQIIIDNTPWFGRQTSDKNIEQIKTAINEKRIISFKYTNQKEVSSDRKLEPYRLILKNSNWYIQGYCLEKRDFRVFRLSRISCLKVLEEEFIPREFDYTPISSPTLEDKNIIMIKLLIDKSLRDYLPSFCEDKNIKPYGNDKYIVDFPFIENDFNYNMLIKFGNKCECLAPESIRLELVKRLKMLLNIYEKE